MRPVATTFVIVGTVVVLGTVGIAGRWRRASGPSLQLPCSLSLGDGKPGEVLKGSFPISNVGSGPLEFSITASCSCTVLEPTEGVVPPGESVSISVGLQLDNQHGSTRSTDLMISTNDRVAPRAVYQVFGQCPQLLEVRPEAIDFGEVTKDSLARRRLRIRDGQGQPIIDADRYPAFRVSGTGIDVHRDEASSHEFVLLISLDPTQNNQYVRASIELTPHGADDRIEVPVAAQIVSPLSVAPASILALDRPDWSSSVLIWRSDGKALENSVDVQMPAGLQVTESTSRDDGNRRRFEVRRNGQDLDRGELRFAFQGLEAAVILPVILRSSQPQSEDHDRGTAIEQTVR